MKRDTDRLVMVGGVILGGAAIAGLIYMLTKKSSVSAALLEETASTRSGPDFEYDLNFGDWVVQRELKVSWPNLGKGSIVRLSMYPKGRADLAQTFGLQIVEAIPVGPGFTIYKGKWTTAPGGLYPDAIVAITSSDISSVAKAVRG